VETESFPCRQRAFRERKERHVRDLEAKLLVLESSNHSLQSDNERLKLALQRARAENEILRARTTQSHYMQDLTNGSLVRSADMDDAVLRGENKSGEIIGAQTWDFIQSHPLVEQGIIGIADAC
jgi:hypothetical protein